MSIYTSFGYYSLQRYKIFRKQSTFIVFYFKHGVGSDLWDKKHEGSRKIIAATSQSDVTAIVIV